MEKIPFRPRQLENQRPEKRKRKLRPEHSSSRRRFLKKAGIVIAGAVVGGKAIEKGIEFLNEDQKEQNDESEARIKTGESVKISGISSTDETTETELRKISPEEETGNPVGEESWSADANELENKNVSRGEPIWQDDEEETEDALRALKERLGNRRESRNKENLEQWVERAGKREVLSEIRRKYGGRVRLACRETKLAPELIIGVIAQESSGNERAVSKIWVRDKKGGRKKVPCAYGLMQITIDKKEKYKMNDIFHPYENILAGSKYLRELFDRFDNIDYALAAYNMGLGALEEKLERGYDPKANDYAKRVLFLAGLI